MKKLMLFLFCTTCLVAQENTVDRIFGEANELYRKENYEAAISKYEYIATHFKLHSTELYFNLGNAYYKLNKIAPAVLNYERALLLDPKNHDTRVNLGYVHKMMIDEVAEVPEAGFFAILSKLTRLMSPDAWAITAVIWAFLILILFCIFFLSQNPRFKKLLFFAMFLALAFVLFSVFAGFFEKSRSCNSKPAIVFGVVSVLSEPKQSATEAAVLHEGTKVYVMEELDQWRHVKLPNGNDGWLNAASIKEIKIN
jgi:hypothetical protein